MDLGRSFLCPECGSAQAAGVMNVTGDVRPDDPWSAVLEIIDCALCGSTIPAHLGERWDGISVEAARQEWLDVYREGGVRKQERKRARKTRR